jgi:hypothetical protein
LSPGHTPDPSAAWVFRYQEEARSGTTFHRRILLRPVVVVRFVADEAGGHRVLALVDSGSDHVLAAPWVARLIGVDPDEGRQTTIGVGGRFREVRFADVSIQLLPPGGELLRDDYDPDAFVEWQAEVGFFREWEPPWGAVLGQVGFFDQFTVTMNRESGALAVESVDEFDRRFGPP